MKRTSVFFFIAGLIYSSLAVAQKPAEKPTAPAAQPAATLADGLAQRLSRELHSKTVVGEPIHAGAVTLIPILMVDVNFAGAAMPAPGAPGIDGFLLSGEARPLGFVVVTKQGARFVGVGRAAKSGDPK